jgi:hypothetical protein
MHYVISKTWLLWQVWLAYLYNVHKIQVYDNDNDMSLTAMLLHTHSLSHATYTYWQ